MPTTPIRGKLFLLILSPDNGASKYTLVCLTKHDFNSERTETEVETQCGTLVDVGEPKSDINVDGICNTTPAALAAGVGEASLELLMTWYLAATALKVYRQSPTGTGLDLSVESACKISKISDSAEVGKYVSFNMKLKLDGDLDITP